MISKKFGIKIVYFILLGIGIFFAGYVLRHLETNEEQLNETMAMRSMAQYLYNDLDESFGNINEKNKTEYNIIGYIPFYKDMGIGIILENGVKTIRVYK